MKRILFALLLCTLLLGCGQQAQAVESRLIPTKETENDNLRCYPLDAADCRFFVLEDDFLLLRPAEEGAQLLVCQGRGLVIAARREVPSGCALTAGAGRICCYDPRTHQALLFTPELKDLGSFSLPDCKGVPQLGSQGRIYYATSQALMELDPRTGIHRTIRQQEGLNLTGLLEGEGLLICTGEDGSQFLRIDDGTLGYASPPLTAAGELGICARCGFWDCLYMGQTMLPLPQSWRFLAFLPGRNAAFVQREDGSLAIYDLSSGKSLAELPWNSEKEIGESWATQTSRIYFTAGGCLYQWEPEWQTKTDNRISITPLCTRTQPDLKGLNQCRQRGAFLENQYGLRVLLGEDALRAAPAGVALEPEYIPFPIMSTLAGIESALGKFPSEFVRQLFSGCGSVYLCPVRSIQAEGKSLLGLQFWSGRDCYLAIAASGELFRGVMQVISPLAERQILMKSDALDQWERWNPGGFDYGGTEWDETAFVSPACLESPEADRAGLLCAAMEPGNRERFLSARLQNKLRSLCRGLREAFPLSETAKRPWEQYLWKQ